MDLKVPFWREHLLIGAMAYDMTGLGYLGADIVLDKNIVMSAVAVMTYSRKTCTLENIICNYNVAADGIVFAKINKCTVAVINRSVRAVTGKIKLYLLIEEIFRYKSICRTVENAVIYCCVFS